jgi:hypothetical protein
MALLAILAIVAWFVVGLVVALALGWTVRSADERERSLYAPAVRAQGRQDPPVAA